MINRSVAKLNISKVRENPWPLFLHHFRTTLKLAHSDDWFSANDRFDRWTARQLGTGSSSVFVGTETCAQRSFEICAKQGIRPVLDCPQLHPAFLSKVLATAADRLKIASRKQVDTAEMSERKEFEYSAADYLLVYSDVHRRSFMEAGFAGSRLIECPLWVDSKTWFPTLEKRTHRNGKLRVLFVGSLSMRKGIPFLLEAVRLLGDAVSLTLVGSIHPEMLSTLAAYEDTFELQAPKTKAVLREIYVQHDVLVLPSLGDSFGFVGIEAMACGIPVIVTENCGVPVPDLTWRIPVMDSEAIAMRLQHYIMSDGALAEDGTKATTFAREFSPQRYRCFIGQFFKSLVGQSL